MGLTYEEIVKAEKDKATELKFKNVRTGIKLALAKHIKTAQDGAIEKLIEDFIGLEPNIREKKRSFLDDLVNLGKLMDATFANVGNLEEGALSHKLSNTSAIIMDRIAQYCFEAKMNNFPYYKEKFSMDMSEEQEAKNIVPRTVFRSIKLFLEKYYFVFRQSSVNVRARLIYTKISEFRDKLLHFEYNIGHYLGMLKGEYIKEVAPFYKDTKKALLRLRKFFEAADDSPFGRLARNLYDASVENATRIFIKNNENITVASREIRKGAVIPIKSILEKYDKYMSPIRGAIDNYDNAKLGLYGINGQNREREKSYWDVSDKVVGFREGMKIVMDAIQEGVSQTDNDIMFFIQTVQSVLIPYMNQTRGGVNESFAIGVRNLDKFFWKIMVKAIESGQEEGEKMDEIAGVAIKIYATDMKPKEDAAKASLEGKKDIISDAEEPSNILGNKTP